MNRAHTGLGERRAGGAFGGALPGDRQLSVTDWAGVTCETAQACVTARGLLPAQTSCRAPRGSVHTHPQLPSAFSVLWNRAPLVDKTMFQNFLADLPSPPFVLLGIRKALAFFLGVPEVTFQQRMSLVSGTRVELRLHITRGVSATGWELGGAPGLTCPAPGGGEAPRPAPSRAALGAGTGGGWLPPAGASLGPAPARTLQDICYILQSSPLNQKVGLCS